MQRLAGRAALSRSGEVQASEPRFVRRQPSPASGVRRGSSLRPSSDSPAPGDGSAHGLQQSVSVCRRALGIATSTRAGTLPVPADYGLRFCQDEDLGPTEPDTAQASPEQPVRRMPPRLRPCSLEHGELLPPGEDLDCVVLSSAEEDSHGGEGNQDEFKHGTLRSTMRNSPRARQPKLLILVNDEVLATHKETALNPPVVVCKDSLRRSCCRDFIKKSLPRTSARPPGQEERRVPVRATKDLPGHGMTRLTEGISRSNLRARTLYPLLGTLLRGPGGSTAGR